jgi:hypothetical protein
LKTGNRELFCYAPPEPLRTNVDVIDRPLTFTEGAAPVWTDAEVDDVIAFLTTLNDRDSQPVAPPVLSRSIEEGVAYGWRRAHKHTEAPDEEAIRDHIVTAVLNEICEYFDSSE